MSEKILMPMEQWALYVNDALAPLQPIDRKSEALFRMIYFSGLAACTDFFVQVSKTDYYTEERKQELFLRWSREIHAVIDALGKSSERRIIQ